MKSKPKSAFITVFLGGVLALPLAACDDLGLPHVFGGPEVPDDILAQPRVVAQPTPEQEENAHWPRLGDVPSKPKDFSSKTKIEKTIFDMQEDRIEGQEEMQIYEEEKANAPVVEVAPAPLPQQPPQ